MTPRRLSVAVMLAKGLLNYGDYSICSFHATKLFHTAEGGCVVSHSTAAIRLLSRARAFGHEGDTHNAWASMQK